MRINWVLGTIDFYGGFVNANYITNTLVERGHNVTIVLRHHQPLHFAWKANIIFAEDRLKTIKRRLSSLTNKIFGYGYLGMYSALDCMTAIIPDCGINICQLSPYTYPIFRSRKGIPFHYMMHFEKMVYEIENPKIVNLVHESMYLPINRIANSVWCRNQVKSIYGYDIPVINTGIDHSIFYPRKVERDTENKIVLCLVKNLEWKGFRDALESMKIVMSKRKDVEFWAFGGEEVRFPDIDVPYKFLGKVFKGDLARLYSSVDAVICPSWYESFPLPPIEAMACGTPVVTTRYGTEDYARDGENALVVMPRKPEDMANAILRLLSDSELSAKFRELGPQTAKQFTWEKTVDKFELLFNEAVAGKKSNYTCT